MRLHLHRYYLMFPALWAPSWSPFGEGYTACRCGDRDVTGPDRYGPYAAPWIEDGTAPPKERP